MSCQPGEGIEKELRRMVPGKSENAAWEQLCEVRVEIVELV